ncbi:hypothetical protein AVEN_20618-1 [Araneus ventricosus]|uniref:TIL domain-containing protein n=1 Tax=Araneus ventricosus TaxID=182803 RepID=A0A4Y2QBP0_ARAVE|nr:hypothetical protein AVEN_20618-1 [Araneus ventricosus]
MAVLSSVWYTILALLGLSIRTETPFTEVIDPERTISLGGGCPDDTKCNIACQEDLRYQTKGSCVGPDKALCSCESPYHATERPVNAEATWCNEKECIKKCSVFVMPMTGRCIKGVCECGWFY